MNLLLRVGFFITLTIMAIAGLYFPYYALTNPELTQSQVLLDNIWIALILIIDALTMALIMNVLHKRGVR